MVLSAWLPLLSLVAQDAGIALYEQRVHPVLRANCLGCHSTVNASSGLALDSQEAIRKGGNRGANPKLIAEAVKQTGDLKMPPGKKLSPEHVAAIEDWVNQGTPMPERLLKAKRVVPKHWAFQPVRKPLAGETIDGFIASALKQKGLALSAQADKRTLLRRVHLDLTGLPPGSQDLEAFLGDKREDAYERVVDSLLASPHYGERWGKHWLDVARYADSDGYTIDAPRDIWPYRDWVLKAINDDMPFDRFVVEQVAGDLLPSATNSQLTATGFHRNTPSNYEGGIDFEQYRVEAVADRVATTGAAFLGLTLGCARCHDHKYDPISQREFYQMFAFWNRVDEVDREADRKYFNRPFLEIGTDEEIRKHAEWQQAVDDLETKIRKYQETLTQGAEMDAGLKELQGELRTLRRAKPKILRTMVMRERPVSRDSYIHLGGDFTRKGAAVIPGTPASLPPIRVSAGSGDPTRLDFANWLVDRENPLTARVTVNRIWQLYFGKGIVDTENDFGTMGEKPTHPELLDFLASKFMESGWSQKALHRLIVTSAVYRQSSAARPDALAVDPENRLLARQNRLRLDAEIIRDAALVASGTLTPAVGGPSVFPPIPPGALAVTQVQREWRTATGPDRYRRGMYTYLQRSAVYPGLLLFDAPDGNATCTRRIRSNSPLQALNGLNDEVSIELAQKLAERVQREAPDGDPSRLNRAFQLAIQREPRPAERDRLMRLIKPDAPARSWTNIARVLLNLDEFMTRE